MKMKRFLFRYPVQLSAAWTSLILILCAMPGRYIPASGWMDLLALDKFVHAALFFVLMVLLILASIRSLLAPRSIFALAFLAICYGVLLEVMQATLFSGRSMEGADVVANTAGVVAALFFLKKIQRKCAEYTATSPSSP